MRPSRLSLLLLIACSCADAPRDPRELDLLARTPDEVFEHPGALVPTAEDLWGPARVSGWESELARTDEGYAFVRSNQRTCALLLPAGAPADRLLTLRVWAADKPREGGKARVRLNGVELGRIPLRRLPFEVELEAPRAAWTWGANLLEIESEALATREQTWRPLALASVHYGEARYARRVEPGDAPYRLDPTTGLRYLLEPLARHRLELVGQANGPGQLEIAFHAVDPGNGRSEPVAGVQQFEWTGKGELERALPLPTLPGRVLQLDLRWMAADGSTFDLERASLMGESAPDLPPIILLSVDTLAARHLSVYGYGRPTSPRLEELARDAVVFESCVANAPWTLPSYLSLLSGLYPGAHYIEPGEAPAGRLETWDTWQLAGNRWTLAEMLRGAGYATAAFVDTPWLSPQYNLDQGFEVFDLSARMIPKEVPEGGIELVTSLASAWIEENEQGPFFAFLHALDPHGPYLPRAPWQGRFADELGADSERSVPAGGTVFSYRSLHASLVAPDHPEGAIPKTLDVAPIIAAYDEEILALDDHIGRFLDDLKRRGIYDDALILVTADHGESFEDDYFGHSGTLHDSILKVPLILKLPGNERGGTRVSETVQLTDVYPTLAELCLGEERDYLHGRSLLGLARGAEEVRPAFSEDGLIEQYSVEHQGWKLIELVPGNRSVPDSLLTHPRAPGDWIRRHFPEVAEGPYTAELRDRLEAREDFGARIQELRRILREPQFELYYLPADPYEERDLAAECLDVLGELQGLLALEKGRRDEARKKARPAAVQIEMSEEDLETLRKLGYVDD